MKIQILIVLLALITISCNEQRRISKFVKKHGPKEIATHIAEEYPHLFKTDTLLVRDSFPYRVEVLVPKIERDSIFNTDTINLCRSFRYNDNFLSFIISEEKGKQRVRYIIKQRKVVDTVSIVREIKVPGPPCPTIDIIQNQKSKHDKEIAELRGELKTYKKLFAIFLILFLILLLFQLAKKYVKGYLQI